VSVVGFLISSTMVRVTKTCTELQENHSSCLSSRAPESARFASLPFPLNLLATSPRLVTTELIDYIPRQAIYDDHWQVDDPLSR
jgi:hypothetical protein